LLKISNFEKNVSSMSSEIPYQYRLNAEKYLVLASAIFPYEEWTPKEANIRVALGLEFGALRPRFLPLSLPIMKKI
jgi:hypothetical protein